MSAREPSAARQWRDPAEVAAYQARYPGRVIGINAFPIEQEITMTETPTSRCICTPDSAKTQGTYCPMHGCPHNDAARCDCPTKMGARRGQLVNDAPLPRPVKPERNVSVRVGDDPRPCTCAPGGMTWEPDCPRHAEMFDTEMSRPPVAGGVALDKVSRELIAALGKLGDEYGPTGVAQAARALVDYPREFWDQAVVVETAEQVKDTGWFCDTAKGIIGGGGQRRQDYGDALDSFEAIAKLWSVVLDIEVTAEQVALCQALLKMGRLLNKPNHTDSWVDIIGYAALGGDISHRDGRHI